MKAVHKGRMAEREVINMLQPILDVIWSKADLIAPKLERRGLGFAGQDITGLEWLSFEVKHRKQVSLGSWWKQCEAQAVRRNGCYVVPVLLWKGHRTGWNVRLGGFIDWQERRRFVDITIEEFKWWFYTRAKEQFEYERQKLEKVG